MKNYILIHKSIFIILIIVVASFLRIYKLGSYPALNADEAAIGYNAYSLLETGKDEHGNPWPIHFQSFNDYKPGLYVYLVMPFVKVLGLNEWAVRLPNALLGILSVYVLYLFIKELRIGNYLEIRNLKLEILAPAMLAASPWHLHFSRGGWEVNTATFFILSGIYFFIKYISRNNRHPEQGEGSVLFLIISFLSFVFSLYSYHSARIVSPLLIFGLIVIYWKELRSNLKHLAISGLFGLLLLMPLIIDFTRSDVISRATGVGLFADTGPIERTNEQRMEHSGITGVILHNKVTNYGFTFLKNWGEHYHGLFLFVSGDTIQRNAVPETGQLYLFEIITVLVGLYFIFKNINCHPGLTFESKFCILNSKFYLLILFWLLIAPIPAALTFQSPHALRAQNMVIPLTIISAIGLTKIIELFSKLFSGHSERSEESLSRSSHIPNTIYHILRFSCFLLLVTIVIWNFARYLHMYYLHMSKEYPYSSQYGVKELVEYIKTVNINKSDNSVIPVSKQLQAFEEGVILARLPIEASAKLGPESTQPSKYKNIVITNKYDQPYILFLFYTKYPPEKFQSDHVLTPRDKYGFSTVEGFGNYIFKSIDWDRDKLLYPSSLIIGTNEEIPDETNITKRIYGSNGYLYFKVVEN